MNFLKRIFSKKEQKFSSNIVKRTDNIFNIEASLINSQIDAIETSYANKLAWWNSLTDDWKRLLMMKSNLDDPLQYDISKTPTETFLNELFERKVFHNMWQPIETLKPLNAFRKVRKLILEFIEIRNFSEIAGMSFILEIIADNSKIESLEGLENFENLTKLTLCNTDVTTLKPIAALKNIQDLDIRGTLIHPKEYEYFRSLHPSTNVSFITPMNPLRRGKESLENPLLDYYKNLINKSASP
jgi:Leucine-rich repeat (LRR) protein